MFFSPWTDRMAEMMVVMNPKITPVRAFEIAENFEKVRAKRSKAIKTKQDIGRAKLQALRKDLPMNPTVIQQTIYHKKVNQVCQEYCVDTDGNRAD
jgi:hypothetical protein